ncbi:DUF1653 domain-containing protein [Candidatus Woesearchaeota archaeon]|jgi:hypothetical protein|nr:DUF1653 domain-containing protein [Candidatus Woesearchaeota archaeon]MBT5273067.1 DUF1653 domain-containing protein [Candidatus Woesearchaeota archaeon]MBT6041006.1 DUF1653 domain-containing protein [Candidatus Woesearchaeota archaeon]MBT6337618.1 DUF1653 domain-containing protein [Candidatus Woesearchaeota archaeon]MBT7926981.1 DUF1653 domain-containing protein [Candidatus Woesearchaeota archaeon]
MSNIKKGKYKHYKGKFYDVLEIGRDADTLEEFIVYKALYEDPEFGKNALWVRKKESFLKQKIKEGKKVIRYEFVEESKE